MHHAMSSPPAKNALRLYGCLAMAATLGWSQVPIDKLLSRGLTPVGSPSANLASLVDSKYGSGSWASTAGSWVAFRMDAPPRQLLLTWNNPSYTWSDSVTQQASTHSGCVQGSNLTYPSSYRISTSTNSTNGQDGTWTVRVSVTGNMVSSRLHRFQTDGEPWVKLSILAGTGGLDEVSLHDATAGGEDSWLFVGTSISANTYKSSPPSDDFPRLVERALPGRTPAVVKAGIPCITSQDVVRNLPTYMELGAQCRNWAIEMGTNDAWGGSSTNAASFRKALQQIVDSTKAHGIRPMFARLLATNPIAAGWQVNPAFLEAIDSVTRQNHLVPGPDLYTYFLKYPSELNSDGVHPNATGGASIQRLWAEAMVANLYSLSGVGPLPKKDRLRAIATADGYRLTCGGAPCASWRIATHDGRIRSRGAGDLVPRRELTPGLNLLLDGSGESRTAILRP